MTEKEKIEATKKSFKEIKKFLKNKSLKPNMTDEEKLEYVKKSLGKIREFFIDKSSESNMQNRTQIVVLMDGLLNFLDN